jgi:hypothetical protein
MYLLPGGEGGCASGDEQSDRVTQSNWRVNSTAASPTRRSDPSLQHGGHNGSSNSSTPGNTAHGRLVVILSSFTVLVYDAVMAVLCTLCWLLRSYVTMLQSCIKPLSARHTAAAGADASQTVAPS